MAKLVTLASLRLQAQQRADMENSSFISTPEWNLLINRSADELYDLLTTVFSDYYYKTASFSTDGINDTYPLPSDFYKLLGVDQVLTSNGAQISVHPYQFGERNSFVKFTAANVTFNTAYIPNRPDLVLDTDTFDGINGWEEYIVVDAGIKALTKEESDTNKLERDKAQLIARINACAPDRDASEPARVTDIYASDSFLGNSIPNHYRYRILGANIKLVQAQAMGTAYE